MIRKLSDAKYFIANFSNYAEENYEDNSLSITFKDASIQHYKGYTRIRLNSEGEFLQYSFGTNWHDRSEQEIDLPIQFVWENRKSINNWIKLRSKKETY
ncbi:hypothetical protein ACQCVK_10685 [Rossellomorea vietnamensis]|uniref:hypothetical protein n=1 Tax=Rossellomorea vietnamensis TaxID=218284 RepID=UPI003CEBAF33